MDMGHHQHQAIEMPLPGSVDQDAERPSVEHVKRPMNAFMVWAKTERRQLAMRLPGMPNSEVSKILGDMWRRLSDEQKDKYRGESEKLRRKHKQEHPDYRYHPKRQSRKQKALDSDSPLAASLIETSKMQHQQQQPQQQHHHQHPRALTPTMNHQRLSCVRDDSRPHSAPPDYQQQPSLMSMAAGPVHNTMPPALPTLSSHVNASAMSSWWSPSSTPPASTFASAPVQNTVIPSPISAQFQTSLPASPSSQDIGGSLSASSSTGWLKQNSPADSTNSKHQRTSPSLMAQQPPRRHSQSPLVNAMATNTRMTATSVPLTTMPTSGSLLPTGTFYDKTPYYAQDQPAVSTMAVRPAMADMQRYAGLTVSTPRVARQEQTSPNAYETASPLVNEARDSVIAPGTVFYPAYQPTTYLPQPTTYQWLDNRTHFVLPDQLATTQHSQVYQQSVAS